MLNEGKVDAIIDLPDKMFSNTGISVQCWILNRAKTDTDVLFINATKMGRMKTRKLRVFVGASDDDTFDGTQQNEIDLIASTYHKYKNNEDYEDKLGFCKKATLEEIKEKDYSLNPGRYVGVDDSNKLSAQELNEQIKATAQELFTLIDESKALEDKVKDILRREFE